MIDTVGRLGHPNTDKITHLRVTIFPQFESVADKEESVARVDKFPRIVSDFLFFLSSTRSLFRSSELAHILSLFLLRVSYD